ncbi:unnamed protein product [Symbiodinium natans]|uniref:Uncharacterized protein n=1 Tax=Symbiodinium natans TaxID=878477 RepID=A0A812RZE7_9DINO|nr:unnamed protein product [Symbiodinium natans]
MQATGAFGPKPSPLRPKPLLSVGSLCSFSDEGGDRLNLSEEQKHRLIGIGMAVAMGKTVEPSQSSSEILNESQQAKLVRETETQVRQSLLPKLTGVGWTTKHETALNILEKMSQQMTVTLSADLLEDLRHKKADFV